MSSTRLYWNYVLFCWLYAAVHGSVDAVLAYSAAELGPWLGGLGGFALYIAYALSALFIAQPALSTLDAKTAVLTGLSLMLLYVDFFLLAVMAHVNKAAVFIIGALLGGIGAGILWPAQSGYYVLNAKWYAESTCENRDAVLNSFAATFAGLLLLVECAVKAAATVVFVANSSDDTDAWKQTTFGTYTGISLFSVVTFWLVLLPLAEPRIVEPSATINPSEHGLTARASNTEVSDTELADGHALNPEEEYSSTKWTATSVLRVMWHSRTLLLLLPYQFCFGFSAGLVNTYVLGVAVRNHLHDGYVGILSGLVALTAACVAWPFSAVSNKYRHGRALVMVLGALCFAFDGAVVLLLSDARLTDSAFIVLYFVVRGVARGVWEGVNKANIALTFRNHSPEERQASFAAIYFASGLAGAVGYLATGAMSRDAVAATNLALAIVALLCYVVTLPQSEV